MFAGVTLVQTPGGQVPAATQGSGPVFCLGPASSGMKLAPDESELDELEPDEPEPEPDEPELDELEPDEPELDELEPDEPELDELEPDEPEPEPDDGVVSSMPLEGPASEVGVV